VRQNYINQNEISIKMKLTPPVLIFESIPMDLGDLGGRTDTDGDGRHGRVCTERHSSHILTCFAQLDTSRTLDRPRQILSSWCEKLACSRRYHTTNASQNTHMTPRDPPVTGTAQVCATVNSFGRCSRQKNEKTRLFTPHFTRYIPHSLVPRRRPDVP
jgi:hypothetical protein